MKLLKTTDLDQNKRLDIFLSQNYPDISRSLLQQAIATGFAKVNDQESKASHKLKLGESVSFDEKYFDKISESIKIEKEKIPLKILFEDEDMLVIDKPAGLVVHPGSGNMSGTLVNALVNYDESISQALSDDENSSFRPGIVHRIDKDTSGVLLVAKNKQSLSFLSKQIQKHQVKKFYRALVIGILPEEGRVENFLSRDPNNRKKMTIVDEDKGKKAISIFKSLKYYSLAKNTNNFTLAEIEIPTGRTHQIRVQMKSIGHPIIGDQTYYSKESKNLSNLVGAKRQLLHASKIQYRLPSTNKFQESISDLPDDFQTVIKKLLPAERNDHTK